MPRRLSILLLAVAALALAVAPLLALLHGTIEPLSWLLVILVGLCAWGAARAAPWARWLAVGVAVWEVHEAWVAWRLGPELRALVPDYAAWRAGHMAAALLLVAVVGTLWQRHDVSGAA